MIKILQFVAKFDKPHKIKGNRADQRTSLGFIQKPRGFDQRDERIAGNENKSDDVNLYETESLC